MRSGLESVRSGLESVRSGLGYLKYSIILKVLHRKAIRIGCGVVWYVVWCRAVPYHTPLHHTPGTPPSLHHCCTDVGVRISAMELVIGLGIRALRHVMGGSRINSLIQACLIVYVEPVST